MAEPLSDGIQFDVQNLPELGIAERPEHNDLVEAVNELGSEPAPRRFHTAGYDPIVEPLTVIGVRRRYKPEPGRKHGVHFRSSKVTGHENEGLGKVHVLIVAQSKGSFVENA